MMPEGFFLCSVPTKGQKERAPDIISLLKQLQRPTVQWGNIDATHRDRGEGLEENSWFAFQSFVREINVGHTKLHTAPEFSCMTW